jgi:hypothetical protein
VTIVASDPKDMDKVLGENFWLCRWKISDLPTFGFPISAIFIARAPQGLMQQFPSLWQY